MEVEAQRENLENVRDGIDCPICFNPYTDGRQPVIFTTCAHEVCQGCLRMFTRRTCHFCRRNFLEDDVNICSLAEWQAVRNVSRRMAAHQNRSRYEEIRNTIRDLYYEQNVKGHIDRIITIEEKLIQYFKGAKEQIDDSTNLGLCSMIGKTATTALTIFTPTVGLISMGVSVGGDIWQTFHSDKEKQKIYHSICNEIDEHDRLTRNPAVTALYRNYFEFRRLQESAPSLASSKWHLQPHQSDSTKKYEASLNGLNTIGVFFESGSGISNGYKILMASVIALEWAVFYFEYCQGEKHKEEIEEQIKKTQGCIQKLTGFKREIEQI